MSGCAKGPPVSAVITELVVQEVEEKAVETSPVRPRALRGGGGGVFHSHLDSIKANIQFTVERCLQ